MDRKRIVQRHNPQIKGVERLSPLSIGNSELGFSVDFTGLQTFPELYETPLGTQSNWGWHYTKGKNYFKRKDIEYQTFDYNGRKVPYPMKAKDHEMAYHWHRKNPHRLQLGQLSFEFLSKYNEMIDSTEIKEIDQKLDLWSGMITSKYKVNAQPIEVLTVCDFDTDTIGVQVKSKLLSTNQIRIKLTIPSPDITNNNWSKATSIVFDHQEHHQSKKLLSNEHSLVIQRIIDEDDYYINWQTSGGAFSQTENHQFQLVPSKSKDSFSFTVSFSKSKATFDRSLSEILTSSRNHWKQFWESGAFVTFEGSLDTRAHELERRVILSQYLTRIHSSGTMPPQETGLMYNSWFGKAHLEMHWWHAAHFPLWGRADKLDKSLQWYLHLLPIAEKIAFDQGFEGVRWPKMIGADGEQSPSPVAPGLIWQQPHPIMLAELLYQANPNEAILKKYKEMVFRSADFMADFAIWNQDKEVYELGPPLIPAQECHKMEESINPPYELEYWKYGLELACAWSQRLNLQPKQKWFHVVNHIQKPKAQKGVYQAHENCHKTFSEKNHDHPSMVAAYGILKGELINKQWMKNTLLKVKETWQWETAWGWDFPMCAMTATRLEEPEMAIDFLLFDAIKNTYLTNGHNYQRAGLTAYLPGNGGILIAIAMMVAGWSGAPKGKYPGFPRNGEWKVEAEGFHSYI